MLKDKHALKHIEEMKAKLSDKPVPALLKAMLAVDPNPTPTLTLTLTLTPTLTPTLTLTLTLALPTDYRLLTLALTLTRWTPRSA